MASGTVSELEMLKIIDIIYYRMLRASYYNDKPEGFVTLEREDGSWREGFCLDGRWDGIVREFDDDRNIKESILVKCSIYF